jgi:hypothetical protein
VKVIKIIAILLLVYVGVVAAFESLLGYIQPENQKTLVITTTDGSGGTSDRVLSSLESNGQLYVSANHWPRTWYEQALKDPNVQVTLSSVKSDYLAVPVIGDEHDRVNDENRHSLGFRILTGFPPRYFIRLDPRQ